MPEPALTPPSDDLRYRAVFERCALPMWVFDPGSLRFLAVNDAAVTRYGYSREEFLGMTLADIRLPEDIPQLLQHVADGPPSGPTGRVVRHRLKDGRLIHVEIHSHPLRWGEMDARLGLAHDVTERVATEAALRESELRFHQLTDSISEVFWLADSEGSGSGLYVSPAYETIWGRSRESLYRNRHQWLEVIHRDDIERVTKALENQANGSYDIEYRILRPDGKVRWIADRAFPVHDADGRVCRVAGVARDITDRKDVEQQLEQSQRLESLGQLTGGVAHDFNNLLTVMLGNAELLAEQLPEAGLHQRLAKMIGEAAQRGAELTQRLLAFARKQALQPRAVDLNRLIHGMDALLRRSLGEHIEVQFSPGAGLWTTLVDPAQLENALLNLAINARDAMPGGGRLRIDTGNVELDAARSVRAVEFSPGPYVVLSVSDSGSGIPPELIGRVFEPFFTTKDKAKGTGLGLAMVYGFVKQSRGHITIDSMPGQGTTLRIYLPRQPGDSAAEVLAPAESAISGGGERVLLVEDDAMVREYARGQLQALGYRVIEAADGRQALRLLQDRPDIELLFTDVVMPGGVDGRALADAARVLRPGLPVLFTSGYAENAIVHHGRLDPGVLLLGKPYRRAELARKLHEALRSVSAAHSPADTQRRT